MSESSTKSRRARPKLSGCSRNDQIEAILTRLERLLAKKTEGATYEAGMLLAWIEGNGIASAAAALREQAASIRARGEP